MRQYETTGARFWAGAIDGVIIFLLELSGRQFLDAYPSIALTCIWFVFINLFVILYGVLLHAFYGQTIGKTLMKIKVIDVSEKRNITFRQAVFRDSFSVISILIFIPLGIYGILSDNSRSAFISGAYIVLNNAGLIWFFLEILTCLASDKRRALHDFIAGTVVVKTEYIKSLPIEKLP